MYICEISDISCDNLGGPDKEHRGYIVFLFCLFAGINEQRTVQETYGGDCWVFTFMKKNTKKYVKKSICRQNLNLSK